MAAAMLAAVMSAQEDVENKNHHEMGTKDLLDLMPDSNDVVLSGDLEKCPFFSQGAHWRSLFCAATSQVLFMAKDANDFVIDRVPLFEVCDVTVRGMVKEGGKQYHTFQVHTVPGGIAEGRVYTFRTDNEQALQRWTTGIKDLADAAMADWKEQHKLTRAQKVQRKARKLHDSARFQSFFGLMILLSFFLSLVQTEMVPAEDSEAFVAFEIIDVTFTALFTCELFVTIIAFAGQVGR